MRQKMKNVQRIVIRSFMAEPNIRINHFGHSERNRWLKLHIQHMDVDIAKFMEYR